MCGISGSISDGQAYELYRGNLDRGVYSSGYMSIGGYGKGHAKVQKILGKWGPPQGDFCDYTTPVEYHLYHSRGPTVETTHFIPDNNHPFQVGDWLVAHNGIISNYKQLAAEYFPDFDFTGKTDSLIIPMLLDKTNDIKATLELIKGTFALWMFNVYSVRLFITRNASTLFANLDTGDFSSSQFNGSNPLEEGVIYEATNNYSKFIKNISYKTDSPYFLL